MYVGNLPFSATEVELREIFGQHGEVTDVAIMMDRDTGRSRGFAFVSMGSPEGMAAAIKGLHGYSMGGRALTVNEARPREERGGGGGYVTRSFNASELTDSVAVTIGAGGAGEVGRRRRFGGPFNGHQGQDVDGQGEAIAVHRNCNNYRC